MKPTAIAAQASVGIVGNIVTERVNIAVVSATTRGGCGGGRGAWWVPLIQYKQGVIFIPNKKINNILKVLGKLTFWTGS